MYNSHQQGSSLLRVSIIKVPLKIFVVTHAIIYFFVFLTIWTLWTFWLYEHCNFTLQYSCVEIHSASVSVCVCVCPSPHAHTTVHGPRCNLEEL